MARTIEEVWHWIQGVKEPVQVFASPRQHKADRWAKLAAYTLRDKGAAEIRERDNYGRFIGVFDHTISLTDFREEALEVCAACRKVAGEAESVLRSLGEDGPQDGLSGDEPDSQGMDGREWRPQDSRKGFPILGVEDGGDADEIARAIESRGYL